MPTEQLTLSTSLPPATSVCIAGGGPAGMMLGYLLARAGVETTVLEKHADFLRDFRGDTVHPSTLQVLRELDLLDDFLALPHQKARQITGVIGGESLVVADFARLRTGCPYIVFMPQWNFLDFLAARAKRFPTFHLATRCEIDDLLIENRRVVGVQVNTPDGPRTLRADLVVGADGRNSTVRAKAQLPIRAAAAPIDVLWMRLTRRPSDPMQPLGIFERGRILAMIERDTYWQCAYLIPKGSFAQIRADGLAAFQANVAAAAPLVADRVTELDDWDKVSLLTVRVDRLRRWYRPGLLCLGDAAHAMSPIGGVGINLAIQDAVAAANALATPLLRAGFADVATLSSLQRRREWPTRIIQALQIFIQNRIITRTLGAGNPLRTPWPLRLLAHHPRLRQIPAYLIGVGPRPEHVRTADYTRPTRPPTAAAPPAQVAFPASAP